MTQSVRVGRVIEWYVEDGSNTKESYAAKQEEVVGGSIINRFD